jgi:hypothetical protein
MQIVISTIAGFIIACTSSISVNHMISILSSFFSLNITNALDLLRKLNKEN